MWPTATSTDSKSSGAAGYSTDSGRHSGTTLTDATKMWPTVRSEDSESCGNHPEATDSLTGATANWGTPRVTTNSGIPSPQCTGNGSRLEDQAGLWCSPGAMGGGSVSRGGDRVDEPLLAGQVQQWATPRASENENRTTQPAPSHNGVDHGEVLSAQAAMWATPRAGKNGNDSGSAQRLEQGANPGLKDQAKQWPTPTVADGMKSNQTHGTGNMTLIGATESWPTAARDFKSGEASDQTMEANARPLSEVACHYSPPAPQPTGAESLNTSGQQSPKRRLNPFFAEWLMGWPPGWTIPEVIDFGALGMESSHYRRQLRFLLSLLAQEL